MKQAKEEGAEILEIRLDTFSNPEEILKEIPRLLNPLPLIATLRGKKEGGAFQGNSKEQKKILLKICPIVQAVDVELSMEEEDISEIVDEAKKSNCGIILSVHQFKPIKILKNINLWKKEADRWRPQVLKMALMPEESERKRLLEEAAKILEQHKKSKKPWRLAIIFMGADPFENRLRLPYFGSALAFGALGKQVDKRLGQPSISELAKFKKSQDPEEIRSEGLGKY